MSSFTYSVVLTWWFRGRGEQRNIARADFVGICSASGGEGTCRAMGRHALRLPQVDAFERDLLLLEPLCRWRDERPLRNAIIQPGPSRAVSQNCSTYRQRTALPIRLDLGRRARTTSSYTAASHEHGAQRPAASLFLARAPCPPRDVFSDDIAVLAHSSTPVACTSRPARSIKGLA